MATPMQHRLLSELLDAPQRPWFRTLTPDEQQHMVLLQQALTNHAPVVECSDVWRAIEGAGGRVDMDAYNAIQRPHEGKPLHMPWPLAVFTATFDATHATVWLVAEDAACYRGLKFGAMTLAADGLNVGPSVFAAPHFSPEAPTTLAALAIANARNATWVESAPNHVTRRRQPQLAGIRFRHLRIAADTPRRQRKETPAGAGDARTPWHHRRGHWALYDAARPLFGRAGNDGWYWRPYVEVGDKQYGTIVQSYSVQAPSLQVAA